MVVKEPAQRYQSAAEVLRDLRPDPRLAEPLPQTIDPAAEAARFAATRRKRRLRYVALFAVACSSVLCVAMLLPPKPKASPTGPVQPLRGVVTNVYADEAPPKLAILAQDADHKPLAKEIELHSQDRVFINGESRLLRDLEAHDSVEIEKVLDPKSGRRIQEIHASRPKVDTGRIQSLQADTGRFVLSVQGG